MCGRFTNHTPLEAYAQLFRAETPEGEWAAKYNVTPGDYVVACREDPAEGRRLVFLRWGLVPRWASDPAIGYRTINARAETVAEKPSFRDAFRKRRCLLAADGFYEWKLVGSRKQPYYIRLAGGRPFAFAGLWERWPGGKDRPAFESCTLVVTRANELVAPIHDRMPVILRPEDYDLWLDPKPRDPEGLLSLLVPYAPDEMEAYPVAPLVNRPGNEGPDLIRPITASADPA